MTTIVSYSEIYKFQTCKREYYYGQILKLQPVEEKIAMMTGVKGHKLLQNFYEFLAEGKTQEEARELVTKSATKLINEEGFSDMSILPAWVMVDNYLSSTDFSNSNAVLIENRFLFPASELTTDPEFEDIQIGFTPDVVFERTGGFHDVEDYKFIQRAWSQKKLKRYAQSKLYQVFLERMGYKVSRSQIRFFNVKTNKMYVEPFVMKPQEEIILIEDFLEGVREVIRFKLQPEHTYKFAQRTMNNNACQYCDFAYPCQMEAEGIDASKTLKYQFRKKDYDYSR